MYKNIILLILILLISYPVFSKSTKMIFIEQIYSLYESNLYGTHTEHKRNIVWLEESLKLPNIHPSQAIVITKTWEEYVKYKLLLRFHIHYLLTKEYVDWGWQFDKQDVVFYNMEWADELKKSFEIAKSRYLVAKHYWEETKKWSKLAYQQKVRVDWEQIEDLNYEIENNLYDYDYDLVIDMRLKSLEEKLKKINSFIADNQKK
ncbi:MAG: hypothetical protein A2086_08170 [Spirochaetes bacterium GWD1_27_9]|nr:MAG: hypothetical protein A2Y34_13700 [Spirochaetes bacterium GWC1_27_15]OHD34496.1 MAG: hypothetical protein A2086_08170 [Spirochaetes bacterium GWD1_27_9]